MLRKTRFFVLLFFIISIIIYAGYRMANAATTDRTMPIIEMNSDTITVSVKGGDDAILEGVTATDEKDGDLTDELFIESRSRFVEKGRYNVTIAVSDKDNHVTKVQREVIYNDYVSPQFSLSRPLKFQLASQNKDDINISAGLSVKDVIDGNISNKIKMSSDYYITSYETGNYPMEFVVTNSLGDTVKLPVTVTIYSPSQENGLPKITLSNYLVNTPLGESIDVTSLIDQINYHNSTYRRGEDGNYYSGEYDSEGNAKMFTSEAVQIDENIDWNTPGVYEVVITFTDPIAELSNNTRCYVVVY